MANCSKCGSDKIIPDVALLDSYGDLGNSSSPAEVSVHGAPDAWIFKDSSQGKVSLTICGECGHAELHVSNARELWEKYRQAQGR